MAGIAGHRVHTGELPLQRPAGPPGADIDLEGADLPADQHQPSAVMDGSMAQGLAEETAPGQAVVLLEQRSPVLPLHGMHRAGFDLAGPNTGICNWRAGWCRMQVSVGDTRIHRVPGLLTPDDSTRVHWRPIRILFPERSRGAELSIARWVAMCDENRIYRASPRNREPITAQNPGVKCPPWSASIAQEILDPAEPVETHCRPHARESGLWPARRRRRVKVLSGTGIPRPGTRWAWN